MQALMEWWTAHGVAVVTAVIAVVLASEGLVRGLEAVIDSLRGLARLTNWTGDDKALTVAARWLHAIAGVLGVIKSQVARFGIGGKR